MSAKQVGTDRQIAALKPAEKPYECSIDGSRGLRVRVFPAGTKQFEFRYTATNGARRRHLLGAYPDVSLSAARDKAATLRVSVTDGADPAAERAAERERARTGETLSELAEAYWKAAVVGLHGGRKRPKRASTIAKERKWWRHIEPKLGSKRFAEIRRADVKTFMRELATDSGLSPASIADIGALVQAVLGFAVHEDRLDANPAIGLARPLAVTSRDRMFNDAALGVILRAAIAASAERGEGLSRDDKLARLGPAMGLAIRLLILTLARRNEVAGARWEEFDLNAKLWTIPSERAKAKHLHVVPLTDDMIAVLDSIRRLHPGEDYLFPSSGPNEEHLDPHSITRAFARIVARHKLAHGSPHDVRRTGATTLVGRYGVSRLVVGLLLGHTPKEGAAVTSVYDRHSYIPEKRDALEKWERHLQLLRASP
jgi:integrase